MLCFSHLSALLRTGFLTVTGFSADEQFVIANDPLKGEVHIPVDEFNQAWQANGARGVVVAPKPIATIPDSTLPLFAGVGAAAALAGLAALGTARKGLGAGLVEEEKDTWQNYSAPTYSNEPTWFDTQTEPAPAPPLDTWAPPAYTPPPPSPIQERREERHDRQEEQRETPPPASSAPSPSADSTSPGTPGHRFERLIVMKDGALLIDAVR